MSDSPHIISIGSTDFAAEVIEKSREMPVLVDFWATWCAPCKMLNPILAKLAEEFQSQLRIAKVDIDQHQQLAMEYGVRSVPTLKLFRDGRIVQELLGAQPENALRQAIDPYLEHAVDRHRTRAAALQAAGDYAEAEPLLRQAIAEEPNYYRSHEDLFLLLVESGQLDQAQALFDSLPANIQAEPQIHSLLPRLEFSRITQGAPAREALEQTVDSNPEDHQARFQLSAAQVLSGEYEAAMDNLLTILRKDRNFSDGAARKNLVDIFNLLGDDPLVGRYRAKLSSLLY